MLSIHLLSSPMFFSSRLRYFLHVISSRWTPTALSLVTTRWQNEVFLILICPNSFFLENISSLPVMHSSHIHLWLTPAAVVVKKKQKEEKNCCENWNLLVALMFFKCGQKDNRFVSVMLKCYNVFFLLLCSFVKNMIISLQTKRWSICPL